MIFDRLSNLRKYAHLDPEAWKLMADFLTGWTPDTPAGSHILIPDQVLANVLGYTSKSLAECCVETHAKYADVQVLMGGNESIAFVPTEGLPVIQPMDPDKDCALFGFKSGREICLPMEEGAFAVFFPGEGHLPCWNDTPTAIRKIVFKIDFSRIQK